MPKDLKQTEYEFKNEATNEEHVLILSGTIAKNYWSTDKNIDAKMVREALDDVDKPITIRLNSGGGDAFQGIEIYNYLKDHPQKITVEITGWAASAASIISMGADQVIMNTGTTMLIHNASGGVWGNAEDIINYGNMVKTLDESIVDIYEERTNQSRETLIDWMGVEKTFTASECLEYGFANRVKERPKKIENEIDMMALVNDAVAKALAAQSAVASATPVPEPEAIKAKTAYEKYIKKGANK